MKHIGRVYCIFPSQAVILRPIPELVAELLRSQSFMLIFLSRVSFQLAIGIFTAFWFILMSLVLLK